jgi:hypothetical protein
MVEVKKDKTIKIGALWKQRSKKDNEQYLKGALYLPFYSDIKIVMFKNKEKKNENSPDWFLFESKELKQKEQIKAPRYKPLDEDEI